MAKQGRKGKYHEWLTEDGLTRLEGWARRGLIDAQIAKNIGIATGTLYTWKNKYNEIDDALKKGKEVIDFEVENALLKRAKGFIYEEIKTITEKDEFGEDRVRTEKILKAALPDTTAQIFWLKNRDPDAWRNNATALDIREQELKIKTLEKELDQNDQTEDKLEVYFGRLGDALDES